MRIEILVLGRNESLLDQVRDLGRRGKQAPFLGEFVDDPPLGRIDAADRGGRVLRQAFMAGQVAAIDIEHRANAERHGKDAERHEGE